MSLLDILLGRSLASGTISTPSAEPSPFAPSLAPAPAASPKPYDVPPAEGVCKLFELPESILVRIFTKLDRSSLACCHSLNRDLHELITSNSAISLHYTLACNSLRLNPNALSLSANARQIPPTSAKLLSTLRERLTRFRNFKPLSTTRLEFMEPDNNLYEYLEGVLLRGIGRRSGGRSLARELAVYDMRRLGEWEDEVVHTGLVEPTAPPVLPRNADGTEGREADGEGEGEDAADDVEEDVTEDIRTTKKFDFEISEFAVDPGMDLLVLVEVKLFERGRYTMHFHLLTLSTFEPHPRAREPVLEWPHFLARPKISLGFQICDEGLFVLSHNVPGGPKDEVAGWDWTTGRLAVTLQAVAAMSFESFVLLSPSSFVIPTIITRLDINSNVQEELDNPADLSWTHHLLLYAFPPLASTAPAEGEPHAPPHTATHVATIDLPEFNVDILAHIPPPRLTIRTDPPPRHTFPTHPLDSVAQFVPEPETGLIVMEVHCQVWPIEQSPHYVMCMLKTALTRFLPEPDSPLLRQATRPPAPVIAWKRLAPDVRMFGPDLRPTPWVCYVYQNRYITSHFDRQAGKLYFRLYDFDPLRVRKDILDRAAQQGSTPAGGSVFDGIHLEQGAKTMPASRVLRHNTSTGGNLPYLFVQQETDSDVALLDGERIVTVDYDTDELEVMTF